MVLRKFSKVSIVMFYVRNSRAMFAFSVVLLFVGVFGDEIDCAKNFMAPVLERKGKFKFKMVDDSIGNGLLVSSGVHCDADRERAEKHPLVIDIGSNKGSTLLRYFMLWSNLEDVMLSRWYTKQGLYDYGNVALTEDLQVYAIDPLPMAKKKTRKMIREFGLLGKLHFEQLALSNATGIANMYLPAKRGEIDEGGQLEHNSKSQWHDNGFKLEDVNMMTLDKFLVKNNISTREISFLKIDAEKSDFNVILGGITAFESQRVQAGQLEYIDGAMDLEEVVNWLKKRQYSSFIMWGPRSLVRLDNLTSEDIEIVKRNVDQCNIFFVRKKDACLARALSTYVADEETFPLSCWSE